AGVTLCRPATVSFWAAHHDLPAWTGSCGTMGCGGLRSLGHAGLGNRAGVLLSPAQTGRQSSGSLLADEFSFLHGRSSGFIPHGQKSLGDREPRLQRRQKPSRPRAYLASSCQQSADRLAAGHAGLDHRTTLPTTVPSPWPTSGAQQCPVAATLVAQSFPPASPQQQLTPSRINGRSFFRIRPIPSAKSSIKLQTLRKRPV